MTADVTPTPDAPVSEGAAPRDRPRVRRLVALLIMASWVVWAVPAWQSTLHEVRPNELIADMEAQRVVGYLSVENVRQPQDVWRVGLDTSWVSGFSPAYDVPSTDGEGRPENGPPSDLLYTLDSGRTRWAPDLGMGLSGRGDIVTDLRAPGARPLQEVGGIPSRDWAAYPGLFMVVLVIGSLVAWPPRRGTRPFWVLVATVPAGIGVIAYALRELATDAPAWPEGHRLRWQYGLGIAIIGGLLLPGLLGLLS